MKAITFSYDDGVTQDVRLIELFNKYGLKATFNLNSELLGIIGDDFVREGKAISFARIKSEDIKSIYDGHEVAAHTLTHPILPNIADDNEIIRQVEQDRLNLSELVGYEVVGMAYPGGGMNNNDHIAKLIRENAGVKYARTTQTNFSFAPQENLYRFQVTIYHHQQWDRLFEMGEKFLSADEGIFYIWGHSYEFDIFP